MQKRLFHSHGFVHFTQTCLDAYSVGFREAPFRHRTALTAILPSLEIIQHGIWNFFRLENEHLNNVGKYGAFKSVAAPYNYDVNEGKDA